MRAPEKPKMGDPCNGCGVCCIAIPCQLARDFAGAFEGPCPVLEHEDGRYWCGFLRNPTNHIIGLKGKEWGDVFLVSMFSQFGMFGSGCDADD